MRALGVTLLTGTTFLMACGGGAGTVTPGPSAVPAATVTGVWTGTASDSTSATTPGEMMGQIGMGSMTWQLTQTGATVTGSMTFSGMANGKSGTFTGTMDADDMPFKLDLPMGTMMSGGCAASAKGTVHIDRVTMTMTGIYSGSNSCSGAFTDGQMTLARH